MEVSQPVAIVALPARRESAASAASSDSEGSSPPGPDGQRLAADAQTDGSSLSDCRDSGVEADAFAPPDADTCHRIVEAVEFYFSDENLLKDAFLLKHVKRNKEGFVSVKLISSFKRVKHISRDWRAVAHAIQQSALLEVSEAGTKARRLQPLPEHDETVTSRTVVAVNLPLDSPTIASVSELFGSCGDISSIRVLKPGSNIPVEVRAAFNKHPDIAWEGVNCAVVEFDLQEQARKAKETMGCNDPEDTAGMHIIPIGKVSNKKKSRQDEQNVTSREEEISLVGCLTAEAQKKRRQRRKKMPLEHSDSRGSMSGTDGEFSAPSSRRSTPPQGSPLLSQLPPLMGPLPPLLGQPPPLLSQPPPLLSQPPPLLSQPPPLLSQPPPLLPLPAGLVPRRASPPSRGSSVFASTDIRLQADGGAGATRAAPTARAKKTSPPSFGGPTPPGTCPWVQRRKASGALDGDRRGSLVTQENVVRAPRGPDGTTGFTSALRRRSQPAVAAVAAQA